MPKINDPRIKDYKVIIAKIFKDGKWQYLAEKIFLDNKWVKINYFNNVFSISEIQGSHIGDTVFQILTIDTTQIA